MQQHLYYKLAGMTGDAWWNAGRGVRHQHRRLRHRHHRDSHRVHIPQTSQPSPPTIITNITITAGTQVDAVYVFVERRARIIPTIHRSNVASASTATGTASATTRQSIILHHHHSPPTITTSTTTSTAVATRAGVDGAAIRPLPHRRIPPPLPILSRHARPLRSYASSQPSIITTALHPSTHPLPSRRDRR
jgi:hypothetical protein